MLNSLAGLADSAVVAGACALLACALLAWPDSRAVRRIPHTNRPGSRIDGSRCMRALPLVAIPAAAVAGGVVAGAGGMCAAIMLGFVFRKYWRSRRGFAARVKQSTEMAAGIRLLVSELRAGAHPATAAEGVAAEAAPEVRRMFADIAATARLGGDVATTLHSAVWVAPELREFAERVARCWRLADVHGIAVADLLASVRRDLEHRAEFARDVESKMAGPRSTGAVLTGLPVFGLLLGEVVGAGPVAVLTGGLFGQVLLIVGTALLCAGAYWTSRLTETAVSP